MGQQEPKSYGAANPRGELVPKAMRKRIHAEVERHKINYVTEECSACGAKPKSGSIEGEIQLHMVDVAIDTTVLEVAKARRRMGLQ